MDNSQDIDLLSFYIVDYAVWSLDYFSYQIVFEFRDFSPRIWRIPNLTGTLCQPIYHSWIHRLIMPPAARNPFVKGFLDLPKLFIRKKTLPVTLRRK
jgi:hypothetical protein